MSDHEENDEALKRPGIKRKRKLDTHDQSSGHAKHAKADPTKKISDFFGKVCFVMYVNRCLASCLLDSRGRHQGMDHHL